MLWRKGQFTPMRKGVMAVVLIFISMFILYSIVNPVLEGATQEVIKLQEKEGSRIASDPENQITPGGFGDYDGDGVFDPYDICVFQSKTGEWVGKGTPKEEYDFDRDGMPDACDANPRKFDKIPKCNKEILVMTKEEDIFKCVLKS